jgi:hypothetical protein
MPKYFDSDGKELENGDGCALTPRKTIHHDAVQETSHNNTVQLAGDYKLEWKTIDTPAVPAYDEVVEWTCVPLPQEQTASATDADRLDAQVAYTAMMTNTLLSESEG